MKSDGALYGKRYRVIVSTDIGGSDEDDFQSMVHFLLYSYLFDVEGLISSPWGNGRVKDIFDVIDAYEKDYDKLKKYSKNYPTPDYLRSITAQGEINFAPYCGYKSETDGSKLIIDAARKADKRPLYILAWGLLEDISQALYDAPDILPKLRVIYIAGPNKKWGCNAYQYIKENHPSLWIIENNSTYRGFINDIDGIEYEYTNKGFVETYVKNSGALGKFFSTKCNGCLRM